MPARKHLGKVLALGAMQEKRRQRTRPVPALRTQVLAALAIIHWRIAMATKTSKKRAKAKKAPRKRTKKAVVTKTSEERVDKPKPRRLARWQTRRRLMKRLNEKTPLKTRGLEQSQPKA